MICPALSSQSKPIYTSLRTARGGGKVATDITASYDEDALAAQRTPEQREAYARLLKLAEEQGVKPLDYNALLKMGGFWPEDEDIDDFVATIRKWRDEGEDQEIP
jgi:hypothetical protein